MKEYYEKAAISNSGMASINPEQGGTPARYKKYILDREGTEEETPSLENGKLVHLYVEDPKAFVVSDVDRPTDMLASWVEEVYPYFKMAEFDMKEITEENVMIRTQALAVKGDRYKSTKDDDKAWKKFCEGLPYLKHLILADEELCITSKQKELIENCVASLRNKKQASALLFEIGEDFGDEAFNEIPMYWPESILVDNENKVDVDCKALLDRVKLSPTNKVAQIIDLKTTSKPIAKFSSSFEFYRYYRQMAWYLRALSKMLVGKFGEKEAKDWEMQVFMVVVETNGLYETKVFRVSDQYLAKGMIEARNLVSRIAYATHYNEWESSVEEVFGNGVIHLIPEEDESRNAIQQR